MKRLFAIIAAALLASGWAQNAIAQAEKPPAEGAAPASDPDNAEPDLPPPGTMIDQPVAVLQALDKISARTKRLTVNVGGKVPFGTLSIEVDACRKAPPEDKPESAAFLKIIDTRPGETAQKVFGGWMFASSPALSAMDHPVYDIWVIDCSSDPTASAAPSQ